MMKVGIPREKRSLWKGEGGVAYWEYEESIYSHTKVTNNCEGRTKKANMQHLRSFDNQERA